MTNSESPSPKKEENNHEYSFSAASDDETEYDNGEVNAVLNDLKVSSKLESSSLVDDENIGKKLMDRKRLRIFATITKKKTAISSKETTAKLNSFCTGSFLQIQVQQCQYLDWSWLM